MFFGRINKILNSNPLKVILRSASNVPTRFFIPNTYQKAVEECKKAGDMMKKINNVCLKLPTYENLYFKRFVCAEGLVSSKTGKLCESGNKKTVCECPDGKQEDCMETFGCGKKEESGGACGNVIPDKCKGSGKKKDDLTKQKAPCRKDSPSKKKDPCQKKEDAGKKDPCKKKEDPSKKTDICKKKEDISKKDPCKKKEDSSKKKDPCKKKEDPSKKKDPCQKKKDPSKKDPCKKKEDPCKKKEDSCNKEDPCKKKCASSKSTPPKPATKSKKAEDNRTVLTHTKHTYYDVFNFLKNRRLPQPSAKKPQSSPKK